MIPLRPICLYCSQRVTVDSQTIQGVPVHMAWCECKQTPPADPHHRGVGYGDTDVEAVAQWTTWNGKHWPDDSDPYYDR